MGIGEVPISDKESTQNLNSIEHGEVVFPFNKGHMSIMERFSEAATRSAYTLQDIADIITSGNASDAREILDRMNAQTGNIILLIDSMTHQMETKNYLKLGEMQNNLEEQIAPDVESWKIIFKMIPVLVEMYKKAFVSDENGHKIADRLLEQNARLKRDLPTILLDVF